MRQSGLAFAGAQRTLEAWRKGEAVAANNDGLVTAEDIGTLDLAGTWLVMLSACNTGLGQSQPGEGVLGLRRGFVMAGAQNLLFTLWPVQDDFTARFIVEFYEAAARSDDAGRALAEIQGKYLKKEREDGSIWSAVRLAGPFVMSSQGTLSR